MGQQQLLLLVLSTVIIGLATLAGIEAFNTQSKRSEARRLQNLAVRIASKAKVKAKKPTYMGGNGGKVTSGWTSTQSMKSLGYPTTTNNEYMTFGNGNGVYKTDGAECVLSEFIVDAKHVSLPSGGRGLTITCASDEAWAMASTGVAGSSYADEFASVSRVFDNTP